MNALLFSCWRLKVDFEYEEFAFARHLPMKKTRRDAKKNKPYENKRIIELE